MLRYKRLLQQTLDPEAETPMKLRALARATGIPVPSLHNYAEFDTLPRIDNVSKLAAYYGESIASLFSEDDDTTAALVEAVRKLPATHKKKLLEELKEKK